MIWRADNEQQEYIHEEVITGSKHLIINVHLSFSSNIYVGMEEEKYNKTVNKWF